MDEPLGALDKKLREQMQLDIRELHRRLGLTIVFVTHDQTEALTMSDRIAVFNHGKIEHIGTPAEIYDRPRTRFVAEFIGETNMLAGQVESVAGDTAQVRLASGQQVRVAASAGLRPKADICFRSGPSGFGSAAATARRTNSTPRSPISSTTETTCNCFCGPAISNCWPRRTGAERSPRPARCWRFRFPPPIAG